VGANVSMLTSNGLLTDIGSWYLGGAATNNIPSSQGAGRRIVPSLEPLLILAAVAGLWVLS